jgi:hypothetical protein
MPFIELKDVSIDPRFVLAFGKMTIPQTMQTPEMYGITIWVSDIKDAIVITYEELEERDSQLAIIKKAITVLDAVV